MARRATIPTVVLAAVVAACGGLVPGAGTGAVIDIPGVGPARVVVPQPGEVDEAFWRWTAARAILSTEDGQLLVAWNGGPAECWVLQAVQLRQQTGRLAVAVEEGSTGAPVPCRGDREVWAVFVPNDAIPHGNLMVTWPLDSVR
jgi:hypothetical protein